MAKFIKRSERRAQLEAVDAPQTPEENGQDAAEPEDAADAYIKSLIDAYAPGMQENVDFSSAPGQEGGADGGREDCAPELPQEDALPETDSDIIRYFNDPDEYKYAEEKRAASIRRGRAGVLRRSGSINPVPEPKEDVEHRIGQVPVEHSVPGDEPDTGKFAMGPAGIREIELPAESEKLPAEADGKTRKFIRPEKQEDSARPAAVPAAEPEPAEKPIKARKPGSWAGNFDEDPVVLRYPEYSDAQQQDAVKSFLKKEKKSALIKLIVCAAAFLLSGLLTLIALILSVGDTERTLHLFGGNGTAFGIVMLALFVIGIAPLANDFAGGIAVLARKKANSDTALLLLWCSVLIQNIVLLITPEKIYVQCSLFNTAALALTVLIWFSRVASVTRTTEGFRLLIGGKPLFGVRAIDDSHRSERVGQGILEQDAKIAYRAETAFMDKYINVSLTDDPSVGICTRLLPVSLGVAALMAVILGIVSRSAAAGATAFAAVIFVTMPLSVTFSLKWLLDSFNRRLNGSGGAVPGYAAAVSFAKNDAVIFDAAELYDGKSMNVYGAKTFGDFALYDCILLASAMFIRSDSPLGSIFNQVIVGRQELLPQAESLIYEDKQGLSAWIDNKKVLAGTRDMMIHHNIEVPDISLEEKYTRGDPDRKLVYLSVEGELAAVFVVSYALDAEIAKQITYLASHGYTILLRSTDPNINDLFVERQLKLAADTVKVINTEAAEYFKMCRNEQLKVLDPGICSVGDTVSSLKAMTAAVMLKNALDITTPLALTAAVLGVIVVALVMIFGGTAGINGFHLFLLQAFWAAIGSFACRILAKK